MPDLSIDFLTIGWLAMFALVMAFVGLVHGTLDLEFPVLTSPLLSLVLDVRSAILITLFPTVCVNLVSIARGGRFEESIGCYSPLAGYPLIGSVAGERGASQARPPIESITAAPKAVQKRRIPPPRRAKRRRSGRISPSSEKLVPSRAIRSAVESPILEASHG